MTGRTWLEKVRTASSIVCLAVFLTTGAIGRAELGETELIGTVLDPSGLGVPGVALTLVDTSTGHSKSTVSDGTGRYRFPDLPAGKYRLRASYTGFAPHAQELTLEDSGLRHLDVELQLPATKESITVATLAAEVYPLAAGSQRSPNESDLARSRNTADLLAYMPGVGLQQNGEIATNPLLHGLGDERTKLVVNGMTISSSCPNHMNPPLSYIDPTQVEKLDVMAGITPVSMGGDSIGGTISVESPQPVFAKSGEDVHTEGAFSTFLRSNGDGYGVAASGWVASRHLSLGYSGSWATTGDYTDGSGHKVASTYSQSTSHSVTLAVQGAGNLVVLQAGLQNTPYQGFTNQQMDLVQNRSEFLNLRYKRELGWGVLDTRVFWQNVRHEMNIGQDKSTFPMPMWMPMDTQGRDLGYSVKLKVPFSERHTLQVGNEFQSFSLNDTWPAVPGTAPWMGPNTFVNVNDGHRNRLGWFGEMASKWNSKLTTLLGVRNDSVWTNAGAVSGYSGMYAKDAAKFNAQSRSRADVDLDLTSVARYEPNASSTFEAGYARKTRAPNLYERYAWSSSWMISGMINWFGDGNYYVGNVGLKPEIAHTVSATASWHDRARKEWEIKLTPYRTYIRDYVGVNTLATRRYGESTFAQLGFSNQDARIYGIDLSGDATIWDSARLGRGEISGVAGWLQGKTLTTGNGLYHIMPPNARIGLDETFRGLTAGIGVQLVDRKSRVDLQRFEPVTPGYALLNLHAGYKWRHFRFDVGGDNLLNKYYCLPLGGVNFDDFMASGWSSLIRPLTGRGRSLGMGLSVQF